MNITNGLREEFEKVVRCCEEEREREKYVIVDNEMVSFRLFSLFLNFPRESSDTIVIVT